MHSINIAIIEDRDGYRTTLKSIISEAEGMHCSQDYPDAEKALKGIKDHLPDIVLVDMRLPGMSGIECIKLLNKDYPALLLMALTVVEEGDQIFEALRAGASGYMLKKSGFTKIIESIHELYNGGAPMSAKIARKVVEVFREPTQKRNELFETELTKREREVLDLLCKGFLYKQIAAELFIALETVRTHCHNIYRKLHVRTRTEAIIEYYERLLNNR